jgi:hypothetical protein
MPKQLAPLTLLLTFLFAVSLISCNFLPRVGGPCTYVDGLDDAVVTKINESFVLLGNEHNQYQIAPRLFKTKPSLGNSYKVTFSSITQGTCTPINIKSVELAKS